MDRLMPFDELNIMDATVRNIFERDRENKRHYLEFLLDEIEEIFILSYIFGNEAANTMLETDFPPEDAQVTASVNREVAGKTWRQRVTEYLENETPDTAEEIMRVVETDSHRIYNEAMWNVATRAQDRGIVVYKRWETMLDDRVRDTHAYLQGEAVPLSEYFFTYDGDFALRPGDFQFPENVIGCRCRLVLTRV